MTRFEPQFTCKRFNAGSILMLVIINAFKKVTRRKQFENKINCSLASDEQSEHVLDMQTDLKCARMSSLNSYRSRLLIVLISVFQSISGSSKGQISHIC